MAERESSGGAMCDSQPMEDAVSCYLAASEAGDMNAVMETLAATSRSSRPSPAA